MIRTISALCLLVIAAIVGCARTPVSERTVAENETCTSIGSAQLLEGGEIQLMLIARGDRGEVGHAGLLLSPGTEEHAKWSRHIGTMERNRYYSVPCWPSEGSE